MFGSPFHWWLYRFDQYSVHLVRISFPSVIFFPSLYCMLLVFGSFFFVRLLTISSALLLLSC